MKVRIELKTLPIFCTILFLVGCSTTTLPGWSGHYKDDTVSAPAREFSETPESRKVIMGSPVYALINGCQLLQRYSVRTNQNFHSSLNLIKNRAYLMGAKWLNVVYHSELDSNEKLILEVGRGPVTLLDGTQLVSARYLTVLAADLYDCPCNTTACINK